MERVPIFTVVILFRHDDEIKEPHRLEIKSLKINESKCKIEFLILLLRSMSFGMSNMSINSSGDCCMSLDELKSTGFACDHPEG